MPTLPLFDSTVTTPGGWRHVIAPGGWQQWRLDVVDDATKSISIITLHDGRVNDLAYQRRYLRFRRSPTRRDPPQPSEYRAVEIDWYSAAGEFDHRLFNVDPADFEAKRNELRVRIGDYSLQPIDAELFHLAGPDLDLTLRPAGSDGTVWRVSGKVLGRDTSGRGILHVDFGDEPKAPGVDYRILFDDRAIVGTLPGRTMEQEFDVGSFRLHRHRELTKERWLYAASNEINAVAIVEPSTV